MAWVPAASWLARLISGPTRSPMSARAASGARRRAATSVSFVTGQTSNGLQIRPYPWSLGHFSDGELEHPLYGFQRTEPYFFRQGDLRLPVPHAEVELLQR